MEVCTSIVLPASFWLVPSLEINGLARVTFRLFIWSISNLIRTPTAPALSCSRRRYSLPTELTLFVLFLMTCDTRCGFLLWGMGKVLRA